jgi:hypothetical protein
MRLLLALFVAIAALFAPIAAQDLCPANSQDTVSPLAPRRAFRSHRRRPRIAIERWSRVLT